MRICVQGLWHLGSVTAACLASAGHDVTGLDFDSSVVDRLNRGKAPLFEPGLDQLIAQGLAAGRLHFSSQAKEAVAGVELLWIAYDTPVDEDDRADVDYVVAQVEAVLPYLPPGTTVLVSSQMPVGSIGRLEGIAASKYPGQSLSFACSPENLRLGRALDVFLQPDRVVVGVRTGRDRQRIADMFKSITERIEWMSVESAEMTKHAINSFLATSVVFANEIASICELVGADAKEVERGLKTEQRIGPKAYLSPGGAFAGGTLARDVEFLGHVSREKGLATHLLSSIRPSNDEHKQWAKRGLLAQFASLRGRTIAVWGLTYKPGTNTLRRSLAVELCNWMLEQGASLRVHDPEAGDLPQSWTDRVVRCTTPLQTITGADALIVATEWPLYREVSFDDMAAVAKGLLVLDANHYLKPTGSTSRIAHVGVGTPHQKIARQ